MATKYPEISLSGKHGYFSKDEEEDVIACINDFSPDLLFVGLGVPKEQFFCHRNKSRLNVGWINTCGGMFKVLCGDIKRPPCWIQTVGLEWLYRCFNEPRHVFIRYLYTNPYAIYLIIKSRLLDGKNSRMYYRK